MAIPKKQNLSDLFYSDIAEKRNAELRKGLIEYKSLLTALQAAMCALESKELEKFDALVGENACQIRAVKIALISSQNEIDFEALKKRITSAQDKTAHLLSPKTICSLMMSNLSLRELLDKEDLDIPLTGDEMFVLQAFILCLMKKEESEETIPLLKNDKLNPKNLKQLCPDVSSTFTYDISRKLRRLLSESSVHFVREIAWNLKDPTLVRMVSKEFVKEHNTRPCIPMFWAYKTLLKMAQKESMPLIIHVYFLDPAESNYRITSEEKLFFKPEKTNNKWNYTPTHPTELDLHKPTCVIQGMVCLNLHKTFCKMQWKENLLKHSIYDVILAGAADHRQYPDDNAVVPIDDCEFENYKILAKENGFSLENPSSLFINHVYSSQVDKFFSFAQQDLNLSANS